MHRRRPRTDARDHDPIALETLEPRVLLSSVWAADLAGPMIDGGNEIASAILDDDRVGLVRSDGSGSLLDYFARDGMDGPPSWSARLEHDIHSATFAGDGGLAALGWFRTQGGHADRGLGLFAPQTADPYAVLVADEDKPFGFLIGSGLSAPGAFTARMNLVLRDNFMLDAQQVSAADFEVRYMGVAGGVAVGASIVQATPLSTPMPEANVVLEFALVGAGSYRVTLREGTIIDLAGNSTESWLMGSAFFGEDSMGKPTGPIWTAPPPPSSGPDRPWELVPVISVPGQETLFEGSFLGSSGSGSSGSGSAPVLVYQTERTDEHGDRVRGFVSWDGQGVAGVGFEAQPSISPIQVVSGGGVLGYEIDIQQGFVISLVLWEGPGRGVSVLVNPDGLDAGAVLPNGVRMAGDGSALVFSTLFTEGEGQTIWFAHRDMEWQPTMLFESSQDEQAGFYNSIVGILWLGDGPQEQSPAGGDRVYTVLYAGFEQGNLIEGDPAQGGAANWEFLFRSTIMSGQVLYRPGHAQEPVITAQPETIAFSEVRATFTGAEYFGLRAGAERAEAARAVLDDRVNIVGWLNRPVNARGLVGLRAHIEGGDDRQFAVLERIGLRPLLLVPGIFGTMPEVGFSGSRVKDWLLNRGAHPDTLVIDPLVETYNDLIASLQLPHVGYELGKTLFVATYDWRMPPAPVHESAGADLAGPWQREIDGVVSGVRINSLGASPTFQHGIDYLAYWIDQARTAWEAMHDGRALPSVDVYAHSTGGLVARSYIQSDFYGKPATGGQGEVLDALPTVNRLISMAVPHEGATKAWNMLNNNLASDETYRLFMGLMIWSAFRKVTVEGLRIESPIPGDIIDTARLDHAVAEGWFPTREEAFIHMYIPTGRALLATYPFIKADGTLLPGSLTEAPDRLSNRLALDLNHDAQGRLISRVDLVSFFNDDTPTIQIVERYVGPRIFEGLSEGGPVPGDGFHEMLYGAPWERVGPISMPSEGGTADFAVRDIYGFEFFSKWRRPSDQIGYRVPGEGEEWWLDRAPRHLGFGDGTVPTNSAAALRGLLMSRSYAFQGLDHGSINADRDVQAAVLGELGFAVVSDGLEEGRYASRYGEIVEGGRRVVAFWRDPVGAYVTDALGRRSGWSPEQGYLSEIPGTFNYGGAEGWTIITGEAFGPLTMTIVGVDPQYAVALVAESADGSALSQVFEGQVEPGQELHLPIEGLALPPADAPGLPGFFNLFASGAVGGMVEGDWIVGELLARVSKHHAGQTDWGGRNYWFQDDAGDVWSLWHGGGVHALDNGEHRWVLTNLTQASGIAGEFDFAPGSLSGLVTPWRGFSLHGVVDGQPVVLSWTPQGSGEVYRDADGRFAQGLGLGRLGNGWVAQPLAGALLSPGTLEPVEPGTLRAFTESQANGRQSFDPRATPRTVNDGISFVVLTLDDQVWVVSPIEWPGGATPAAPIAPLGWTAERLEETPGPAALGLIDELDALRDGYVERATR